jgi:hypothetical protein
MDSTFAFLADKNTDNSDFHIRIHSYIHGELNKIHNYIVFQMQRTTMTATSVRFFFILSLFNLKF